MTKVLASLVSVLALFGLFFLFSSNVGQGDPAVSGDPANSASSTSASGSTLDGTHCHQHINQPPIPDVVSFAGEQVPLHIYDVRERLDRELLVNTYFHSKTMHTLKLANRIFKKIEPILAEMGVPDDLKYVAMAESGLLNVVSPANAKGIWQFVKSSANDYGLEVSSDVDERYHLEKSTRAAAKYFRKANSKFNSWAMAMGSYNMGMSGIAKQAANQKTDNYYDLYLNAETSRYVFRILAFKLITENPDKYGFYLDQNDLYPEIPTYKVEVNQIANIADFAKQNGTNYKELKLLNPWLRSTSLAKRKSGKAYILELPS